jgi:hypothetical protein
MTTEIAKIENTATDCAPKALNKKQAQALDKKIKVTRDRVVRNIDQAQTHFDYLLTLLEQAERGDIHKALGCKSWPAYLKDTVRIVPVDRAERKLLVSVMSGNGLSQRAIADVLGVSKKTVQNDQVDTSIHLGATTGSDGKKYPPKPAPEPEPLDVDEVPVDEIENHTMIRDWLDMSMLCLGVVAVAGMGSALILS